MHVSEVRVEIGPLSGVKPIQFAAAFEELVVAGWASRAQLVIDEVALLAECRACNRAFEVNEFVFRCPTCRGNVHVTRGDAVQLVSVSLQNNSGAA